MNPALCRTQLHDYGNGPGAFSPLREKGDTQFCINCGIVRYLNQRGRVAFRRGKGGK